MQYDAANNVLSELSLPVSPPLSLLSLLSPPLPLSSSPSSHLLSHHWVIGGHEADLSSSVEDKVPIGLESDVSTLISGD